MNTPAPIAWIVPALTITTSPALTSILLSMSVIVLLLILSRISSLDASLESPQYRYDPGSLSTTYHISFFPYSFSFSRAYSSSGWICIESACFASMNFIRIGNLSCAWHFQPNASFPIILRYSLKSIPLYLPSAIRLWPSGWAESSQLSPMTS